MKILLRYTFPPLFMALLIFIATCLLPSSQIPTMPEGIPWDKLTHSGMFLLLSGISLIDYYRLHKGNPPVFKWMCWGFFIPVVYGGGIELLQKFFFSSRSAEWGDWFADLLGSLVATVIVFILFRKRRYYRKNISL